MNWYIKAWKKYAVFSGRAGREEYWYFVLFNILVNILLMIIAGVVSPEAGFGLLGLYTLAVLIPGLAVSIRRLHDTNRSGWWLLITLIPGIGSIVLLIFMLQGSQPNENQYGAIPKIATA
ncbi:MAG: DUF805 domain-containing protein [Blastocatellia bacterium]